MRKICFMQCHVFVSLSTFSRLTRLILAYGRSILFAVNRVHCFACEENQFTGIKGQNLDMEWGGDEPKQFCIALNGLCCISKDLHL